MWLRGGKVMNLTIKISLKIEMFQTKTDKIWPKLVDFKKLNCVNERRRTKANSNRSPE